MSTPVILTSYVYPPIPIRSLDWEAYLDGWEETGPYGHGETCEEAVADLREKLDCLDDGPPDGIVTARIVDAWDFNLGRA